MKKNVVARGNVDDFDDAQACAGMGLLSFDKTPAKLRNPGVTHGYRRVGLPLSHLLRSMFSWHNETLNVWTHLIPGLLFLTAFTPYIYISRPFPSDGANPVGPDRILVSLYSLSASATFLLSSAYHLLGPYSLRAFAILHKMDLIGIQLLITASYIPALHCAFRCSPLLHRLYLSVTVLVFVVACVCLPILDYKGLPTVRNVLFLAATAWGVIPTLHFLALSGSKGRFFLRGVAEMYVCYAVGFFFFASKLPERNSNGRFNFLGHSHQWWHLSVVLAACLWLRSLVAFSDAMGPGLCAVDG